MPVNGPSSEPASSIYPGATISGRFRLVRLLGRGSMGSVWLARHLTLDVDVAVKFIDAAYRDQKDHRGRFALEAQAAARINSPHVVNVIDFGAEVSGRLYIAMEYLQGEDLGKLLERSGRLSPAMTARVVSHACRGLARAHALGIAHRDVKPENLFLVGSSEDEGFVLKILDFGVAKSAHQTTKDFVGTAVGQLVGSPAYMSPEQAHGSLDVDFRSDLFSIAVVAYHCLTGVVPFGGDSLAELLIGIVSKDPVPATRLTPGLPRAVDDWFQRALDKNPARRFASAKDLAQAFHMSIGQNASSATDYSSSPLLAAPHAAIGARARVASDTVVNAKTSHKPNVQHADVSNHTASTGVPLALAQVAEVANVLGIALVSPEGDAVAHHSLMGLPASTFSDVTQRVKDSLDTFESLETTRSQALALYFEHATVLIRWVESHAVIVVATEQVHPTVLSVSLNAAASKLQALAKQAGGAAVAFRSTISSLPDNEVSEVSGTALVVRPSATDPVSDATIARLTQLYAKPLGAVGRLAIQQRLKSGKPTVQGYPEFVKRLSGLIEDTRERAEFFSDALRLVPQPESAPPLPPISKTAVTAAPPATRQPLAPSAPQSAPAQPAPRAAMPIPPRPAGATPSPANPGGDSSAKAKKFVVYRGRKIEVDE
ncbi:MAG TPA: serine/threonine-protein kinase [Polyangiaceae bacterium]|nr:serine/threonine-protein kinase [Polyangiaceae bacterium]